MYGIERKRLDQIGEVLSGATPSTTKPDYWNGEVVWITPNDLSKLGTPYLHTSGKLITEKGLESCSARLLPPGSLTISSRAPIGYVAIPTVEFCTNQGCKSIELRPEFDSEYAYYNICFHIDALKNVGEGTTFSEISKSALAKVEMPFIKDRLQQTQIATILSTIDKAIEQTEAIIAKQQRIKTGLMQDLLTRGIDEHGNVRSEETHVFKDSPLGRIPVEWEVKRLHDIGEWFSGGTPSKSTEAYWGAGVSWVCPKDMKVFDLQRTTDSLTEKGVHAGSKIVPPEAVFIVVRGMILAHSFPVCISRQRMAFNQDVKAIVTNEYVNSRYFAYWLYVNANSLLKLTTTATHGTKRFDMSELFDVIVGVPGVEEQYRITKIIDSAQRSSDVENECLRKLRRKKNALMQDLLTGKVRVTPLLEAEP